MSWISVTQHEARPLRWWLNEFRRDRIDVSPAYQRRSNLWSQWKKAHLIDSLINGFDIPKFYVADFNVGSNPQLNKENKPYAVIDGKQRFEAIFSFMQDEFELNESTRLISDKSKPIGGLRYSDLRNEFASIAERIESFLPVVMSVRASEEALIEQLFVRLNSGVAVNGAERRNAMPGPVPESLRTLTLHPFFAEKVRFSKNRMQEFNLAAKLMFFEWLGDFGDTKARDLDLFVSKAADGVDEIERRLLNAGSAAKQKAIRDELDQFLSPYEDAEARVLSVLESLDSVFTEKDPILGKQGGIPIYYWIARNHPNLIDNFRPFLLQFEKEVLEAVRTARTAPAAADPELIAYYTASRTINDSASLRERYRIMLRRLKDWS